MQVDFNIKGEAQGFTLLELLVTLVVLGIVIGMGSVVMVKNMQKMEAMTLSSQLKTFLVEARQDALIYQDTVVGCTANDNLQCVQVGGEQLISFLDKNENHVYDAAVDQLNHQVDLTLKFGYLVTGIALNRSYIEFKPDSGRPIRYMGNIRYCCDAEDHNNSFKITFNKTGIIKYQPYAEAAFSCG